MRKLILIGFLGFMPMVANAGEGHDAGADWAYNNGITDPSECPSGNSWSFEEGCREFAMEACVEECMDYDNEDHDTCYDRCNGL